MHQQLVNRIWIFSAVTLAVASCTERSPAPPAAPVLAERDQAMARIMDEHDIATVGAAIISDGEVVWTGYYGEQASGVPATEQTMFNVASIAKTVTAELILRLVDAGEIDLDEPMAPYWVDPDIADDPRHKLLTPRIALNHTTGFKNWRFMEPDFTLRIHTDPGTSYSYSGEGMDYVARFAEKKLDAPFQTLVQERVLDPMGLENTSMGPKDWVRSRIAIPIDDEGVQHTPFCEGPRERFCLADGEWSSAADLAVTVDDYARFMISAMNGEGISADLQAERFSVQTSTADDPVLACTLPDQSRCPKEEGMGLGWQIYEFDDAKIIGHGGNNWSEKAIAYIDMETQDGLVLFMNSSADPAGTLALIEGMEALEPGSRMAMLYRNWIKNYGRQGEASE